MRTPSNKDILGCIVFDLDGTLIDTMPQHAEIFGQVLYKHHSIPMPFARKFYYSTAGIPLQKQFQHAVYSYEGKSKVDAQTLEVDFWNIASHIKPIAISGVQKTLKTLEEANYRLFISSGSRTNIVISRADYLNISKHFDCMLGTDIKHPKLSKGIEHIKQFSEHLDIPFEMFIKNSAIVGDGVHDIEISKKFGLISIGVATSTTEKMLYEAGADFVIKSTAMLLNILGISREKKSQFRRISDLRQII